MKLVLFVCRGAYGVVKTDKNLGNGIWLDDSDPIIVCDDIQKGLTSLYKKDIENDENAPKPEEYDQLTGAYDETDVEEFIKSRKAGDLYRY